jgi:hypothetical protein
VVAQEAAPAAPVSPPAPASAPDVVLLQNGDLFRGTIAEKVSTHTTIVLLTGETRRFEAAQIRYAGPAEQLPKSEPAPAPAPAPAPEPAPAPVAQSPDDTQKVQSLYFTANRPGAVLFTQDQDSLGFRELCEAPCQRNLPEGPYTLAAKADNGSFIGQQQLMLNYPANVDLHYRSRAGLRGVGRTLAIGSAVAAVVVFAIDINDSDEEPGLATTATVGLAVPALITGLILLSINDAADIKVTAVPANGAR